MPKRFGVPISSWPVLDRAAWERAHAVVDFFAEDASAAHWRPKSKQQARFAYGRWLSFARERFPEDPATPELVRITEDRIRIYADWLAARVTPMSVAAEFQHLLMALRALSPSADWSWLGQFQYRWQKRARPRDHRHKMVHPTRLLDLGIQLMDRADKRCSGLEAARQYRDGLLIAMLIAVPLRRRTLVGLRLDRQLQRVGAGYVIVLDRDDTKAGHAVEFDVPERLTPYLSRYVDGYRLRFPAPENHRALWLSSKGGALGAEAIYHLVCRRTKEAFGFAIHPHLFRTIAATTIAREAPESIAIARDLLTHAKLDTTIRFYTQAKSLEAARKHAAVIARVRTDKTRVARRHGA